MNLVVGGQTMAAGFFFSFSKEKSQDKTIEMYDISLKYWNWVYNQVRICFFHYGAFTSTQCSVLFTNHPICYFYLECISCLLLVAIPFFWNLLPAFCLVDKPCWFSRSIVKLGHIFIPIIQSSQNVFCKHLCYVPHPVPAMYSPL